MKIGIAMFPTDYSITPSELAQAVEERGFEFAVVPRTHAHSDQSQVAVAWWAQPAGCLQADARSLYGADCGGYCN